MTEFKPKGIMPTAEQRAIQLERHKHVIVEANAGAAKTTTLALRIAQALERGAAPKNLLALTYTPEAVRALKQALERVGLSTVMRNTVRVQTFDDFCAACLQSFEDAAVPKLEHAEQLAPTMLQAIERVLDNPDERHRDEFVVQGSGEGMIEGLLDTFVHLKGTMKLTLEAADRAPSPALADELGIDYLSLRVYWAYEHFRRGGHPDHPVFRAPHDATYDLAKLLLDEEAFFGLPQPLAQGLHLILLDEMHDTNRAMFTVLKGLLQHNPTSAFVGVGDRDQVIHGIAGADAGFMGRLFDEEIAPPTRLPLTATYRFGPQLAQYAGHLAKKPYTSQSPRHTRVQLLLCEDAKEAHWHIGRILAERQGLPAKPTASDVGILLRQAHQSVELENHLHSHGVTYRTAGFSTYLMRPEVLFVRGLMAHARQDFEAIELPDTRIKILKAMLLFCGAQVKLEKEPADAAERTKAEHATIRQVATTPKLAPYFVDNQILRQAHPAVLDAVDRALSVIGEDDTHALLARFVSVLKPHELAARVLVRATDIAQVAGNIEGLTRSAAKFDNVTAFFRAMNEHEMRLHGSSGREGVVVSSIEAAKGLEFEHVIIPGLNRGEFAVGGNTADNRNLLYVGMTRARQQLTLLCDRHRPSQYLIDAGLLQGGTT